MAPPVAEQSRARRLWRALREATPGRAAHALRLAAICTLTLLVAAWYGTPEAALTIYVVFFMNPPERTTGVALPLAFTVIVTLLLGFLFLIATPVLASNPLRLGAMVVLSLGLMFLGSASKLQPVASIAALVVAYCLDLFGQVPAGELATRGLLYAWLIVAIPAAVSVVVNLLCAPSPYRLALRSFAFRLRTAAAALAGDAHEASEAHEALARVALDGDEALQKALRLAALERTAPAADLAALRSAADDLVALLAAAQLMTSEAEASPPAAVRAAMADTLRRMADIFERGGYPAGIAPVAGVEQAAGLAQAPWRLFNAALARFGESRQEKGGAGDGGRAAAGGFWAADAFSNPLHLRHAVKTTLAAMTSYLIYSMLNWPGIHTALITCFIVSLGTAAESIEKLTLRVVGCLAGAAFGIFTMLVLIPHVDEIGILALIVFVGALAGAWVAAGSARISYAGLQFAFAFFLCVVQGNGPGFDLVVARDRVIGILLGNIVSWIVLTRLWPVGLGARIDHALLAARELLPGLAGREEREGVEQLARRHAAAQASLCRATIDISLAALEPPSIRPAPKWLMNRLALARQARRLAPWLLAAATAPDPLVMARAKSDLQSLDHALAGLSQEGQHHAPMRN